MLGRDNGYDDHDQGGGGGEFGDYFPLCVKHYAKY